MITYMYLLKLTYQVSFSKKNDKVLQVCLVTRKMGGFAVEQMYSFSGIVYLWWYW